MQALWESGSAGSVESGKRGVRESELPPTPMRRTQDTRQARLYGKTMLRLLRRPQQNFAGEGLRSLGHDHSYGVGYVRGLQHLLGIFSRMRAELGVNRAGADDRNATIVVSQFFGDRVGQSIQCPLRGGLRGPGGESVLYGRGVNV